MRTGQRQLIASLFACFVALGHWSPIRAQEEGVHVHVESDADRRGKEHDRRGDHVTEIGRVGKDFDLKKSNNDTVQDVEEISKALAADRAEKVLERVERGESDPHRNDGGVFRNNEGRLPERPDGYYKEYVYRNNESDPVGRERVIVGRDGDVYYTPDHYETFTRVK